jgi:hypothetical protein
MMPYGRGFGFRGWSPAWPFVGRGRGGLPRCWAYGANWGASYANPNWVGAYPHPFPGDWDPYGMDYSPYSQLYPEYPQAMGAWESYYESPMTTGEGEKEWLKSQAESIRQQIDQIKNRISELEKE